MSVLSNRVSSFFSSAGKIESIHDHGRVTCKQNLYAFFLDLCSNDLGRASFFFYFCVCVWQKTTALKKAYAEIILNTAKESAARVMLSDRKSARFHHDLSETKEEALRLLVRLKHMIDAKVIFCSLSKKKKQSLTSLGLVFR